MEAAEWQHGPAAMAAMAADYGQTVQAMEADEMAVEWLREYAKGWPPGSGPPREVATVQREIDRDNETRRGSRRCDWKMQGRVVRGMETGGRCVIFWQYGRRERTVGNGEKRRRGWPV